MKCPIDGSNLVIAERSGVEIDYCPQCRGVWLDRGELDKIIDRSAAQSESFAARDRRMDDEDYGHSGGRKRRGGLLADLFDFD